MDKSVLTLLRENGHYIVENDVFSDREGRNWILHGMLGNNNFTLSCLDDTLWTEVTLKELREKYTFKCDALVILNSPEIQGNLSRANPIRNLPIYIEHLKEPSIVAQILDDLKAEMQKDSPWIEEEAIDDFLKTYGDGFVKFAALYNGHDPAKN
jgi:hypothetical protein